MPKNLIYRILDKTQLSYFWLLSGLLCCLPAFVSAIEINLPVSQAEQQAADLRHFVRDREIKILDTDEESFITLMKEQSTGFAKGIAFIVPEVNQSIHRQAAISGLYDKLNDYGWTSLLLTMPSEIEPVFGTRDETQPNASEQQASEAPTEPASDNDGSTGQDSTSMAANDTSTDTDPEAANRTINPNLDIKAFHRPDYYSQQTSDEMEQKITKRMQAAWKLANEYPGFFLVICQGKSCNWLTNLFIEQQELKPDALVMLSAHMPQSNLNEQFAEQLSKTEFPVLDLYQSNDNPWVLANVPWRKKMARKNYKTDYRQRQLYSGIDYYGQERRTIKEIYGFLTAVGM